MRELWRREPFLGTRWLKRGMQVVRAIFYAHPASASALWSALVTFRSRLRFEHRLGKWSKLPAMCDVGCVRMAKRITRFSLSADEVGHILPTFIECRVLRLHVDALPVDTANPSPSLARSPSDGSNV